jgi:hypothetical protein
LNDTLRLEERNKEIFGKESEDVDMNVRRELGDLEKLGRDIGD